jgi:hypothetical protein
MRTDGRAFKILRGNIPGAEHKYELDDSGPLLALVRLTRSRVRHLDEGAAQQIANVIIGLVS